MSLTACVVGLSRCRRGPHVGRELFAQPREQRLWLPRRPGSRHQQRKSDFRVLKQGKREDGPHEEEADGERRPERDEGENTPELPKRRPEDPDRVSATEDRRSQEASIETPKRRHVPGGAWLSKLPQCATNQVVLRPVIPSKHFVPKIYARHKHFYSNVAKMCGVVLKELGSPWWCH
ncbi:hypothetical protein NDU88_005629 [Pleurodeles waltl]|uniref:Uncharacterized protein n=1 Tax=Pleurodeles waltl TaxID=8319 RepID=A0AAV7NQY0_PLEWA|nr:hypothetical protein NDU88_005629 [Pleurodeles waltl]